MAHIVGTPESNQSQDQPESNTNVDLKRKPSRKLTVNFQEGQEKFTEKAQ